jgi:hypothetical protein
MRSLHALPLKVVARPVMVLTPIALPARLDTHSPQMLALLVQQVHMLLTEILAHVPRVLLARILPPQVLLPALLAQSVNGLLPRLAQ